MSPLVAATLTFGSFGDILEAAKIAKRMIDVLRKREGSRERQKLISTLKAICDDLAWLTVLPEGPFTTRLWDEVVLCRSLLLDQFYAKINSSEGIFGRLWRTVLEETELASWRDQISERREVLRGLFGPLIIIQLRDVGEQMGCVSSHVQYPGSRVENIDARAQNVDNQVGTLSVFVSSFPSWGRAYLFYSPNIASLTTWWDYKIMSTTDDAIIPRLRLGEELKPWREFDMNIIKRKPSRPPPGCLLIAATATEVPSRVDGSTGAGELSLRMMCARLTFFQQLYAREAATIDSTNEDPQAVVMAYGRTVGMLSGHIERVHSTRPGSSRRNDRPQTAVEQEEELRRLRNIASRSLAHFLPLTPFQHDIDLDRMSVLGIIYNISPISYPTTGEDTVKENIDSEFKSKVRDDQPLDNHKSARNTLFESIGHGLP
ncbi:hypothetical protein B0H19DRAFT_1077896 [Mycena capillaripes]|nr:hypothetical protein B0H19DRAFT_1077896 [Mycena capillaripes]